MIDVACAYCDSKTKIDLEYLYDEQKTINCPNCGDIDFKAVEEEDTFYFIVFTDKGRKTITVIDLAHVVAYERDDWINVNDITMYNSREAVLYAREKASNEDFYYEKFDSRYHSFLNE
jgi:uncharacterized Zn finger protein